METTVISVSWPVTCLAGCLSYAFNNNKMRCVLHASVWSGCVTFLLTWDRIQKDSHMNRTRAAHF